MLKVRPAQMTSFDEAAWRRFEDEMVAHSKEFTPRLCEVLGDDQLRVALRRAITRARDYGFTYRGPIRLYVEMMFLFGSAFDSDPQYPWAARILHGSEEQMVRADRLCEAVLDYQAKVSGPEAANTRRALADLRLMAREPLAIEPHDFDAGMRREMHRVFPEKATYIGEPGLTALIHEGRAEGRKHRFPAPRGEAMLVTLMFAFGHGCSRDPLYPWITRTLTDDRIVGPAARAERLERKAGTWLEHVLVHAQERTRP